jgi:hypothetical protein
MKLVLSSFQQRLAALVLALVALALIVALLVMPLWQAAALHNERISMLRTQARKLEALIEAEPRFAALAREVALDKSIQALTFTATQPSVGVAELQTTLNRLFSAAGASVMSGQAVEQSGGDETTIAVKMTLETDIASLVRALYAIGAYRPLMSVERLAMNEPDGEFTSPPGTPAIANKLIVDVVVSARLRVM